MKLARLLGISGNARLSLGGERTGCKPGHSAEGKAPFVAAVETTKEG